MTLKDFIVETNRSMIQTGSSVRPVTILGDGTVMSIQASNIHYSRPKRFPILEETMYSAMEVGFENRLRIEEWKEKYEYETWPNQGINILYGYVEVDDIEKFINEHGGIDHYEF